MVLFLIGLGLGSPDDITLRGLDRIRRCSTIFLEAYTAVLPGLIPVVSESDSLVSGENNGDKGPDAVARTLEEKFSLRRGSVQFADREVVESKCEEVLLAPARTGDVALLVVGDPFGATTHTDLQLRAREAGVSVEVVHNASVMTAIGCCGLQLYRYGETISIVFFTETWKPDSFYDKIKANREMGLHTLCLLDIRVKEPSLEALCRGRKEYEPARFMTVDIAATQLLELEEKRQEGAYGPDTLAIGVARLGHESQDIIRCPLSTMAQGVDLGKPLHSLIIPGTVTEIEEEALRVLARSL